MTRAATTVRPHPGPRLGRQVEATGRQHALEEPGDEQAEADAEHRGEQSDEGGFEQHRAQDLRAGGAERPQQGQLADPLAEQDREGVVDEEGRDEQRDAGKGQQHGLEDGQEPPDLLGALVDHRATRHRLGTRRHHGLHPAGQLFGADLWLADEVDGVGQALRAEHLVGPGRLHGREPGAEQAVGRAEGEHADDLDVAPAADGDHLGPVAGREPEVVGGPPVDGHLAGTGRGPAPLERRRVEPLVDGPVDPEQRRPGGRHGLALLVEELGVPAQLRSDRVHPLDRGQLGRQRQRDPTAAGDPAEARLQTGGGPHRHVDLRAHALEQLVDGRAQGVGDDERPDHEPHAEHHGEGGAHEAQLVRQQRPDAEGEHRRTSRDPEGTGTRSRR
jgi:hypothetical protein